MRTPTPPAQSTAGPSRARESLGKRLSDPFAGGWGAFGRIAPDLPEIRRPRVWAQVFDEINDATIKEEKEKRRAAARSSPNPMAALNDSIFDRPGAEDANYRHYD